MSGFNPGGNRKLRNLGIILAIPFFLIIISFVVYKLFLIPPPVIDGVDAFSSIPKEKTVTLHGKNLQSLRIRAIQGIREVEILKDAPESREKTYTIDLRPGELGLTDGSLIIVVEAKSGILKKTVHQIDALIDTIPPKLELVKFTRLIKEGSAGAALLKASGADSVYIRLEDHRFKAFRTEAENEASPPLYLALFPVPMNSGDTSILYAVAEDMAGNKTINSIPARIKNERFSSSNINITEGFLSRVIYPLLDVTSVEDPVNAFREVNEKWRGRDKKRLLEISEASELKRLWDGRFLQLKNSKVMATYGDMRTYLYSGKPVSESIHLGYDFASVENAPVEASNSGLVGFAGNLGIYGNTVIIDHGLGLMSLYGHLSEIMVKEGQEVKKGEIIARTGSTGLAGGDHLHFGILIHGIEVSPIYWFDHNWIKVNILDIIG